MKLDILRVAIPKWILPQNKEIKFRIPSAIEESNKESDVQDSIELPVELWREERL